MKTHEAVTDSKSTGVQRIHETGGPQMVKIGKINKTFRHKFSFKIVDFCYFLKSFIFFSKFVFFRKIFLPCKILFFVQVFFSDLDYITKVLEN